MGESCFLGRAASHACSPHRHAPAVCCQADGGLRAQGYCRGCEQGEDELNLDLLPTAPTGVTQNVLRSLLWPKTCGGAGEMSRRLTGFYSAFYGVIEGVKSGKEVLKESLDRPEVGESWEVALPGAASQAGASYRLSQRCSAWQ